METQSTNSHDNESDNSNNNNQTDNTNDSLLRYPDFIMNADPSLFHPPPNNDQNYYFRPNNRTYYFRAPEIKPITPFDPNPPYRPQNGIETAFRGGNIDFGPKSYGISNITPKEGLGLSLLTSTGDALIKFKTGLKFNVLSNFAESVSIIGALDKDFEENSFYNTTKEVTTYILGRYAVKLVITYVMKGTPQGRILSALLCIAEGVLEYAYQLSFSELADILRDEYLLRQGEISAGLKRILDKFGIGGVEFKNVQKIDQINSPNILLSLKSNIFFETKYEKEVREAFNSLCLPNFQNRKIKEYFETIIREISDGININGELPFVSLHFNNNHLLYSVMDSYYKNTIVGNLLAYMDYFLKGFVNGGFFDVQFVKKWIKLPPHERLTDLNQLNANLIDIKKSLKKDNKRTGYKSIYDFVDQEEMMRNFSSAFRIIGEMNIIETTDNIFFPKPTFSVQHDINPYPKLQKLLASEGPELDQFQKIFGAFYEMRTIIHDVMPKVPYFRGFFFILDMITFAIYYNQSLLSIGKTIDTKNSFQDTDKNQNYVDIIPEVFPPLPVSLRKKVNPEITRGEILESLQNTSLNKEIENNLYNEKKFSESFQIELQNTLIAFYRNKIANILKEEFNLCDDEDIHLFSFLIKAGGFVSSLPQKITNKIVKKFCSFIPVQRRNEMIEQNEITHSQLEAECSKYFEEYKQKTKEKLEENEQIIQESRNKIQELNEAKKKIVELQVKMAIIPSYQRIQPNFDNFSAELADDFKAIEHDIPIYEAKIEFYRKINDTINAIIPQKQKELDDLKKASHSFLQIYKEILKHEKKIQNEFFIQKPVIASFDDGRSIEGGCLINVHNKPILIEVTKSSKYLEEIHSYLSEKNNLNQEFINCSNGESGYVIDLDIIPSFDYGRKLALNRVNDFFKDNLCYDKIDIPHIAAKYEITELLNEMTEKEINQETSDGMNPAFFACSYNSLNSVDILIKKGADFGKTLQNGIYPFLTAIQSGYYTTTLHLLLSNANIGDINKATETGMTPLHWAIYYDFPDIVKILLSRGASLLIGLKGNGMQPIHLACYLNRLECLSILSKSENAVYDETDAGLSPLHISIQHSPRCAMFLIENKLCDLNLLDPHGFTMHDLAIINGQYDIANKLPDKGKLKKLLEKCDIENNSNDLFSQLLISFETGDIILTEQMFAKWSKQMKNKEDLTPEQKQQLIDSACCGRCIEFVEILSRLFNLEETPIAICASRHGLNEWILEIMKHGGNLMNEIDNRTILDEAAENKDCILINTIFSVIKNVPEKVIKRVIKRSIELDDINTIKEISRALKTEDYSNIKLIPEDVLFSFTTVQSFIILQENFGTNNSFNLNTFIESISYNLAKYLLNSYNFEEDDLISSGIKAYKKGKHDIVYLIVEKYPSIISKIASNRHCSDVIKITKENLETIKNEIISLTAKDIESDKSKSEQLKNLFNDKFNIGEIEFFKNHTLLELAGNSMNLLWVLMALPEHQLHKFTLSEYVFEKYSVVYLFYKLINIFTNIVGKKKAGSMFLNSLKKLNYESLDLKGFGDEFVESLIKTMSANYLYDVDDDNQSIFHIAAKFTRISQENMEKLNKLIINETNSDKMKKLINARSRKGDNLLTTFALSNNYSILESLLEKGANSKNRDIYGNNILHNVLIGKLATNNNVINCISLFIKKCPDLIIQRNRKGKNPFMIAAEKGFNGVLSLMTTYYPVSILDSSPKKSVLHLAAKNNFPETIRFIVQKLHININLKSMKNYTPLHYAVLYGSLESFKELIELGANPLISTDKESYFSAINYAFLYGTQSTIDTVMNTASFNLILSSPKILTSLVVNMESYYCFNKILEIVDPKCLNECLDDGSSLVSLACLRNNTKTLSDLLLIGCDSEKPDFDGQNPIHKCAKYNSIGCSALILNHINDIKGINGVKNILCAQDSDGDTPLHIAVRKGFQGFVVHLLTSCCDFDLEISNNSGYTPFAESIKNESYEIAGILKYHYLNVLGNSKELLLKLLLPNLMINYIQFSKSESNKNGINIVNQIKNNMIKYQPPSGVKPNMRNPSITIDNFLIELQNHGIYLNQDFLVQNIHILSNYYFQMKLFSHLQEEGVAKLIFESMLKIDTKKILDISCLTIFINIEKGENVKKFFEMIIKLDSLGIKQSHPLFSWIENGLISIAETVKKTQSILDAVNDLLTIVDYIKNNDKLMNIIDYPSLPAPIHEISSSIFKIKEKRLIPIAIHFANILNVSKLWDENPSLSIDICNRLENDQNLLINYAIDQQFGEYEIERIIQITLELYEDVSLNDDIRKLILEHCKKISNKSSTRSDFAVWTTNSIKIIRKFGIEYFQTIIPIIPQSTLQVANEALSAILTIGSAKIADTKLIKEGIDKLKNEAENIKKKQFVESRNLEEILKAFEGESNEFIPYKFAFDGTPVVKLSSNEINNLRQFGNILEKQSNFISISDVSYEIGKEFRDNPTIENAAKLVALTRQAINEVFGLKPFIVQCLTVFSLLLHRINKKDRPELKGRIAQVATGEGKSIIIAMLAGSIALTGSCVDVISSSMYLAERDAEKFKPYYEKLGLKCGTVSEKNNPNGFDYHVLYSTNLGFEFALLREGCNGDDHIQTTLLFDNHKKHRPFMTAIVDEADNLFIDTAANSAIIAQGGNSKLTWIFKPIWECVCNMIITPESIRKKLKENANVEQIKELKNVTNEQLNKFVSSAFRAIKMQRDVDYVIGPSIITGKQDILIIDADNTGRIKHGCRWMNGLHEFTELKEGLPIQEQSYTVASISHPSFFKPYEELYGLTGTLGEEIERKEIRQIYNVDSFDVPPNRQCQRIRQKTLIVSTEEKKESLIIEKIREITSQGRPILVIVRSIKESQEISNLLRNLSIKHYVLNDQQEQDEDFIIDRAGKPGSITIATNTAGRGTDIHVDELALQKGGLHTLITFFPANLRVECQALGRSGRQGQKGSCQIIFESNEYGNDDVETTDIILKNVYSKRTKEIEINSLMRENQFLHEQCVFNELKKYFDYIQYFKRFLKIPESELILKSYYPETTFVSILNELQECWGEYFTSATADKQEPSFQSFLNYWAFHKKYVFLFQPFNEFLPDELKFVETPIQKISRVKSSSSPKKTPIGSASRAIKRGSSQEQSKRNLPEDLINNLVEMGFEKKLCEHALYFAENDFKYAISILMSTNSHEKNENDDSNQDNLKQLVSNGFDRKLSEYALSITDNDIDVAFNLLANGLIKNDQIVIENPKSDIIDPAIRKMINNLVLMGFNSFSSEIALKKCNYNFRSALNLLMKYNGDNNRAITIDENADNLQNLMNIGFERKLCEHALKIADNNFKDALAYLSDVIIKNTRVIENKDSDIFGPLKNSYIELNVDEKAAVSRLLKYGSPEKVLQKYLECSKNENETEQSLK